MACSHVSCRRSPTRSTYCTLLQPARDYKVIRARARFIHGYEKTASPIYLGNWIRQNAGVRLRTTYKEYTWSLFNVMIMDTHCTRVLVNGFECMKLWNVRRAREHEQWRNREVPLADATSQPLNLCIRGNEWRNHCALAGCSGRMVG